MNLTNPAVGEGVDLFVNIVVFFIAFAIALSMVDAKRIRDNYRKTKEYKDKYFNTNNKALNHYRQVNAEAKKKTINKLKQINKSKQINKKLDNYHFK